jgi:hypothetical protein
MSPSAQWRPNASVTLVRNDCNRHRVSSRPLARRVVNPPSQPVRYN